MEEKVIEMRNIYKKFGNVNALNDVDLILNEGEVLGLVGDNAAGKSTLCKILAGAHKPTSGRIIINNSEINFNSPADAKNNNIEMVYQDLSLCNSLDVAGNLFLGREIHKNIFGLKFLDKNKIQDIFKVCDRVMVMYEGRKVADKLINETTLQDLVELIVTEH